MKRVLRIVLVCTLILSCMCFFACSSLLSTKPEQSEVVVENPADEDILSVYNLYVASQQKANKTPLSYEEWLETVKGEKGDIGEAGKSAYQLAVENGFVGTLSEWLESLKSAEDGHQHDVSEWVTYSYLDKSELQFAVCLQCWETCSRIKYNIDYYDQAGVYNPNPEYFIPEEGEIVLENLEMEGYTFEGWFTEEFGGERKDVISKQELRGWDLYSRWTINSYAVELVADGDGEVYGAGTYDYNSYVYLTATPNIGSRFVGWFDGDELVASTESYAFTMPAEALSLTAKFERLAITYIEPVDLGEIDYGTDYSSLVLPTQVSVKDELGATLFLDVEWQESDYNAYTLGEQRISGTVSLSGSSYYLAEGVNAVAKILVKPGEIIGAQTITGIESIELGAVGYNTQFSELGLPQKVKANLLEGGFVEITVSWESSDYNPTAIGEQTIDGIAFIPYGYQLGDDVEATTLANVEVVENVIVNFDSINLGRVPLNTTFADLGLPTTIGANTALGEKFYCSVAWERGEYVKEEYGTYVINGAVEIPSGFSLQGELSPVTTATVVVSEAMKGIVDISFVVDTTGSMSGEIANVKNNINLFAQKLDELGINVRWALVEYRDITCDGNASTNIHLCLSSNWYINVEEYKQAIAALRVSGGGDAPETVIDALEMSRNLDMREGANKFFIVVTDAGFKVNNNYGIYDMNEMIGLLVSDEIITSVVTATSYFDTYTGLTDGTGGLLCNIYGNFADELLKLVELIDDVVENRILCGIEIRELPNKTQYFSGDYFNGAGLKVYAKFLNGEERELVAGYTVSPNGALSVSDTQIEISYRGYKAYVDVTVLPQERPVTGIELSDYSVTIFEGEMFRLTYSIYPFDAVNQNVIWISDNLNVATVENGRIVGVGAGTTTIRAITADGGYVAECIVTVNYVTDVESVELSRGLLELAPNESATLYYQINPVDVSYRELVWSSSNESVATVIDGVVYAHAGGTAIITLSVDGVYTYCRVVVESVLATYSVSGSVYEADSDSDLTNNLKLNNVKIELDSIDGLFHYEFYTNSEGFYSGTVNEGEYVITATLSGYQTATLYAIEISDATVVSNILLVSSVGYGNASGYAKDASTTNSISGISVYIRNGVGNTTGEYLYQLTTNSSGAYSIQNLEAGNYTFTFVDERSLSSESNRYNTTVLNISIVRDANLTGQNANMIKSLSSNSAKAVLSWGSSPSDLDFHLVVYNSSGTQVAHVYYSAKTSSYGSLDVDDRSSYGPETITMTSLNANYTYVLYVHNYSGGSTGRELSNSGATVTFACGSESRTFNVCQGNGTYWNVCKFTVNGGLQVVNTITSAPTGLN